MVPNTQTQHRGEAFEYGKEEIETLLTSENILKLLTIDEIWAMLTLYLTGARLGEIAPMLGEDLVMVRDTQALHIREDHSMGRTVKNYSSIRRVPVHPYLKELGFTEYANRPAREPLFPSLWDRTGNKANRFSRKLKKLGQENGIKPTVRPAHGFRHHVIGLWREAEKRQDLQGAYLGHANNSQQSKYSDFKALAKSAETVWPPLPD
ncbi:tyrosine-type recombinase/integrase [Marinobacter aromaticivorans]|uniref:Tyrosine-type recombinase/integrase n=1 Tax=Marinobacter aromaticivorans TaxID=1494078 RepID=A0ABW2IR57_9GAMM|nr:tyrosine-type recombinase/integrase [Marinobacter aromaticivorans]